MNREKMMATAKKLDTFCKVLQRILTISMLVALCVVAVLTVVHLVDPDAVIGTGFNRVDIGPLTLEVAQQYAPGSRTILIYSWICLVVGVISAALMCRALGQFRLILQRMAQGEPFHRTVADHIRRLAGISLWLGVVHNAAGMIETAVSVRFWGLSRLADGGQIRSITANFNIDLTFLIVFFVLLLISYIFRYGAELQQLSDETL